MLSVDIAARVGAFQLSPAFTAGDELVALIGASGSGKSLTLRAIAGLLKPDSGRIVLPDGAVAFDADSGINLPPQQRNVGYLVQDLALFPHLTVRENIEFPLHSMSRAARNTRAGELIAMLGLAGAEDRRPREISGGQQQRVALARALAAGPRLLLLDEPFSALDESLRLTLRREVLALRRRLHVTALLVTHDVAEAYSMADRIVVYHDGTVVQSGTRDDVFYRPATVDVARLVGVRNLVPGEVAAITGPDALVRTTWFTASVPAAAAAVGDKVFVCIRPEHVLVQRELHPPREARDLALAARVTDDTAHPHGHSLLVELEPRDAHGSGLTMEVDVPTHPYELLGLATDPCRTVVLPYERLFLVPRSDAA